MIFAKSHQMELQFTSLHEPYLENAEQSGSLRKTSSKKSIKLREYMKNKSGKQTTSMQCMISSVDASWVEEVSSLSLHKANLPNFKLSMDITANA